MSLSVKGLEDQTVFEKETAVFSCQWAYEECEVRWYFKGAEVRPEDERFEVKVEAGGVRK